MAETTPTTATTELPSVITRYLAAHRARDVEAALGSCTPDVVVTDEGRTYRGADEVGAWLARAASAYTYTIEATGAAATADGYDVVHHLEGDFPGGTVDLHFRFTLRDDRVARLVIEP